MHYSRHSLMAFGDYVSTRTYAPTKDQWSRPAFPLASSSKTKPFRFSNSTVQLRRSVGVFR